MNFCVEPQEGQPDPEDSLVYVVHIIPGLHLPLSEQQRRVWFTFRHVLLYYAKNGLVHHNNMSKCELNVVLLIRRYLSPFAATLPYAVGM